MNPKHIPNLLTFLRFFLIIPIVWSLVTHHTHWAFYLFFIAGVTDALDGLLARVNGWASPLGAAADPIADKLLLMSSFLALYYLGIIPLWLAVLVVARDLWLMGGGITYRLILGPFQFTPSFISKLNTCFQILLVALLLLDLSLMKLPTPLIQILIWLVSITSIASLIHYTWIWSQKARKALQA